MTVQVVGGPNQRTDYHDDPVEEFFYQLKGDMVLKVVDNGQLLRRADPRGRGVPAAAARAPLPATAAGRLGRSRGRAEAPRRRARRLRMVLLRVPGARPPRRGQGASLVQDLPPLYEAFYAGREGAQLQACGAVHPGKTPPAGWAEDLTRPGRSAACNGALQTRDRHERDLCGPGSAMHHCVLHRVRGTQSHHPVLLHRLWIPHQPVARPLRHDRAAVDDPERLLHQPVGPVDIFEPVGGRRRRQQVRAHFGEQV